MTHGSVFSTGTITSFRIGRTATEYMTKEFYLVFTQDDIDDWLFSAATIPYRVK